MDYFFVVFFGEFHRRALIGVSNALERLPRLTAR